MGATEQNNLPATADFGLLPEPVQGNAAEILRKINALNWNIPVTNPETATRAGFCALQVKGAQKDLDKLKKAMVEPYNDKLKKIRAYFSWFEKRLEDAQGFCETGLRAWDRKQKEEAAKKQREAEERAAKQQAQAREMLRKEAEAKKAEAAAALEADPFAFDQVDQIEAEAQNIEMEAQTLCVGAVVMPEERTLVSGLNIRSKWVARIVDAALIPREYLIPDEKLLGRIARESEGKAEIPGVVFEDEGSLVRRAS